MKFSNGYIFGFAAGICVVCSLAVASTSIGLRDLQDTNKRRDLQGSILGALKLPEDGSELSGPAIDKMWEERVRIRVIDAEGNLADDNDLDGDGDTDADDVEVARAKAKGTDDAPALLAVYERVDQGDKVGALAIPMYGNGLWGPISGYLALGPDGRTVIGSTFFAPKETPGLGAEIQEPFFENQWEGKKLVRDGSIQVIDVVKPGSACPTAQEHCVDGVSGATITSRGVDEMVEDAINYYEPYLKSRS